MSGRLVIRPRRTILKVMHSAITSGGGGVTLGADLTAIEALTGTGVADRTADDVWTLRTTGATGLVLLATGTPGAVRTALSLVPGTDVQAYDAELTGVSAWGAGDVGYMERTGVGSYTWSARIPVTGGGTGANDAAGARTALGLAIGSDVQAYDADLSAAAAIATTGWVRRTGAAAWSTGTPTAAEVGATPAPSQTTITPGTTQTDLDLTGYTDVRIIPTASCMCVSIVAEAAGTAKMLRNLGTYPFLLVQQSPLGIAANRMQNEDVGSGTHVIMLPGDVVRLVYDGTDSRWTTTPVRDVGHRWMMRQWLPSTGTTILATTLPFSGTGTNTAVPVTSGSYLESRWRFRLTTLAVTSSIITVNAAAGAPRSLLGNGAGLGGFAVRLGFGNETEPDSLGTAAIGFTSDTSVGVGNDFDLLTDFVGFELNPGDSNWHWMSNNNTGTATRDNLGAGFPRTAGVWLRAYIYADPFVSGRVSYAVWREDDVTVTPVLGDDTTDLPTTVMGGLAHVCNRTSALIHTFSFDEITNWTPS